jgi:hypothetical protein
MKRAGILTAVALVWLADGAAGAQLRYRYVPVDAAGNTTLQPAVNAPGVERTWLGLVRQPADRQPRPNAMVTFRHTITGQPLAIPLALPDAVPTIQHAPNRIVYNYGSYSIQVLFLADGSAEVVYRSGPLRGI